VKQYSLASQKAYPKRKELSARVEEAMEGIGFFFTAPKLLDYADQIIDSCRLGRSDKLPNIISIIRKIVQTHDLIFPKPDKVVQ